MIYYIWIYCPCQENLWFWIMAAVLATALNKTKSLHPPRLTIICPIHYWILLVLTNHHMQAI